MAKTKQAVEPNPAAEPLKDNICYPKNFLTEVIVRVDFLNPLPGVDKQLPNKVVREIKKFFPISEPRTGLAKEYRISPVGIQETISRQIQEWHFHGRKRDKSLTIIPDAFFITYNVYKSFENLETEFSTVLSKLLESGNDLQAKRFGLRYINNVNLNEDNPLRWEKYINNDLLQVLHFPKDEKTIARAFNVLELNLSELNVRFQFGVFNPDFPAPVKQKLFVLDFDAYYGGVQESDEIFKNLDRFHTTIQELFESSITNELRKIMNEKAE